MPTLLSKVPLAVVIWLFPLAFLIHDGEEIATVEWWMRTNGGALRDRLGRLKLAGRRSLADSPLVRAVLARAEETNTARFSAIVAGLFVGICAAAALAASGSYLWVTGALIIFFVHIFTHLGQTLLARRYTPGVVTAVVIALPYSVWALGRLLADGAVTWATVWSSLPIGLAGVTALFVMGYALGRLLIRRGRA